MATAGAVLVIDDDRNMRDVVAAVLEAEGYDVRCAENGAQALAILHGPKPGAILLDLAMPVMSGWELLDAVRCDGELERIPIMVVSAMRAPAGVPHLAKPLSPEDLIAAVDRICQR